MYYKCGENYLIKDIYLVISDVYIDEIHNIAAKAALKFGSEAWVLKKGEEQRLEAAQMKFWDIYLE